MEPVVLFESLKDSLEEAQIANKYFAVFDSPKDIPVGSRVVCRYFIQETYIELEKLLSERASYLLNTYDHLRETINLDHKALVEWPNNSSGLDKKDADYRLFFLQGIPLQAQLLKRESLVNFRTAAPFIPPSILESGVKIAKRATAKNGLPLFYLDLVENPSKSGWKLERIGDACFSSLEGTNINLFYRNLRTALLTYRREEKA